MRRRRSLLPVLPAPTARARASVDATRSPGVFLSRLMTHLMSKEREKTISLILQLGYIRGRAKTQQYRHSCQTRGGFAVPMARFLAIDVGAGTLDAMFLDTRSGDQFKFVAKSPTRALAQKIMACESKTILITGRQMGGGPITEAIKSKARACNIMMTRSAAETIHHRMERVETLGVRIVSPREAQERAKRGDISSFRTGDLRAEDLMTMLKLMGIEPAVDCFGIGVQDHGTPKGGVSSLDFRHQIFKEIIDKSPKPSAFLFEGKRIPSCLRRMRAAAMDGKGIPSGRLYVMDTGMAAILGASSDPLARGKEPIIVLDIATSHTLGALLVDGEIGGFFEYHTGALAPEILKTLIIDLAEGRLSHRRIVSEGGHGAYVRRAVGFDRVERIVATGPKRSILKHVGIDHIALGAPFGDNMMTGTAGLVLAMAEREGVSIEGSSTPSK